MPDVAVNIAGLKMRNPLMLASGILGETGASLNAVAEAGAGAVVTKSVGLEPRPGHGNPTVAELDHGLLNAMGLPNPGIDEYGPEVRTALEAGVPVIGSVFGGTRDEFVEVAKKMEAHGVHALELNMSCPHAKGYGAEVGSDPENVREITSAVKAVVKVPVFVKLTPNTNDVVSLAKAVEAGHGDAVVAINTLKGMAIDVEMRRPVLGNVFGGYSGPGVRPVGVRCVYEIYKAVKIPTIGVGGIASGRDALEYILAGASAVQVGTAIWRGDKTVFPKITGEVQAYLSTHGFNLKQLVGKAHEV